MPVNTACPACRAAFVVNDALLGKKVRCKHCQRPFTVTEGDGATGPSPATAEKGRGPRAGGPKRAVPGAAKGSAKVWIFLGLGLLLVGGGVTLVLLLTRSGGDGKDGPGGPGKSGDPAAAIVKRLDLPHPPAEVHKVFVPRPGGDTVVVALRKDSFERPIRFDRWSLASGQKLSSTDLAHLNYRFVFDVAPDGGLVAVDQHGKVTLWSLMENRAVVKEWHPKYRRREEGGRHTDVPLLWVSFLDQSRVLVTYQDGAADVWTIPQLQAGKLVDLVRPQGGVDLKYQAGFHLQFRIPLSFTLSADRRLYAHWNGEGYSIYDTHTRKPRARTADPGLAAGEKIVGGRGIAFSPDGSRLVSQLVVAPDPKQPRNTYDVLVCWDTTGGQRTMQVPVRLRGVRPFDYSIYAGVIWWGPKHVLLVDHAAWYLFDMEQGKFACTVAGDDEQRFAGRVIPGTADGHLWYTRPEKGKYHLRVYRLPEAEVRHLTPLAEEPPENIPLRLGLDRVSVAGFTK